jgi:hypothetical protein
MERISKEKSSAIREGADGPTIPNDFQVVATEHDTAAVDNNTEALQKEL